MRHCDRVLLRLSQLESLVLLVHDIASDGVPVAMFERVALPKLKHLQFGRNDPVNCTLDLSARRGRALDAFPYHALQLIGGLESLHLGGQNISCFPGLKLLPGLCELRKLNLSGTTITYLPPSVLFEHSQLEVDLSSTPVSEWLDWSHHSPGSEFIIILILHNTCTRTYFIFWTCNVCNEAIVNPVRKE